MFANLKKKIEAEVGDLSKLTPSFRSITQSERMTPLSSRHNSVSSLTSEPSPFSNSHKAGGGLVSSPTEPGFQSTPLSGANGGGKMDAVQQKLRRQYEEKMQTLESDFAWRLSSKDEEIGKLQKQLDHLNGVLHSKEHETQQKLVRVQEDMDSLEGFSQQENAKIKHLLLNREEEVSQLRASVMSKESAISEFEGQVKNLSVENDRLRKSLDEVVGRTGTQSSRFQELENSLKETQTELKMWKANQAKVIEVESAKLQSKIDLLVAQVQEKDGTIGELRVKVEEMSKGQEDTTTKAEEIEFLKGELAKAKGLQSTIAEFESQIKNLSVENAGLKKSLDEVVGKTGTQSSRVQELENSLKDAQAELSKMPSLQSTIAEFELREKKLLQDVQDLRIAKENVDKSQEESNAAISSLNVALLQLQSEIDIKETMIATLQSKIEEVSLLESEHRSLVLQVTELQSRCVELEEVNKFLKESAASTEDTEALKRRIAELEGELLNKTQTSKQQCLQLQEKVQTLEADCASRLSSKDEEVSKLQNQLEQLSGVLQSNESETQQKLARVQKDMANLEESSKKEKAEIKQLLKDREEELNKLRASVLSKESAISEFENQVKNLSVQNEGLKKSLEEVVGRNGTQDARSQELENSLKSAQAELSKAEGLQNTIAEFELREKKLLQEVHDLRAAKEGLDKSQEENNAAINSLNVALSHLQSEIGIKETMIATLQSKIEEVAALESEHSELVLQISEIQSRCDELEEENKFVKESSASSEETEALKRRVADLEGELNNKTQNLKQQSLQLQDLRRSLAKEINKNQTMSESASPMEMVSQCNGAMSQSPSSSSATLASSQPPTLPPQETDVNFMYLRSVLFKYLTTTDVQVTQQLTRVVATLLHLSEEESHLLCQAADNRNSFFHLIGKS